MTDRPRPVAAEVTPEQHKRLRWALVLISLAQLMVVLDSTIANIALPYIGRDLDIDQANLQWIVTGYALTFGGFLLLGGRLADLYGRRLVFMIGVLRLRGRLAASAASPRTRPCCSAPGPSRASAPRWPPRRPRPDHHHLPGRQGAQPRLRRLRRDGRRRCRRRPDPRWLADRPRLARSASPAGATPSSSSSRSAWPPPSSRPRFFDESERHAGWLDVPGAITGTGGLLAIVYGLSRAGEQRYGWGDTTHHRQPGGRPRPARRLPAHRVARRAPAACRSGSSASRNRATAFAVMMIVPAAMFAMFFFLSLFIQLVVGYSPLHTGVAFLPFSIAMIISATTASKLIARVDPRFLSGVGTLLSAAALYGFSRITVPEDPASILAAPVRRRRSATASTTGRRSCRSSC